MIKAVAVDDEPRALDVIEVHLDKINFIDLCKKFRDPTDALSWMQTNPVDLIFLDINMPNLSGLKFRELVGKDTMIIFTTAYSEYALESYNLEAIDYLLKPITFERFFKGALKAQERWMLKNNQDSDSQTTSSKDKSNHIFIKSGSEVHKLDPAEIRYIAKDGNYAFFHLERRKIITRLSMQQLLDLLPDEHFLKVHKSFIISVPHVDVFERSAVRIRDKTIPVSKKYNAELVEQMKRLNLKSH